MLPFLLPGLSLLEKVLCFGLDLFIKSKHRRDELKKKFNEFFKESGKGAAVSADLHKQHEKLRNEPWPDKEEPKK